MIDKQTMLRRKGNLTAIQLTFYNYFLLGHFILFAVLETSNFRYSLLSLLIVKHLNGMSQIFQFIGISFSSCACEKVGGLIPLIPSGCAGASKNVLAVLVNVSVLVMMREEHKQMC